MFKNGRHNLNLILLLLLYFLFHDVKPKTEQGMPKARLRGFFECEEKPKNKLFYFEDQLKAQLNLWTEFGKNNFQ